MDSYMRWTASFKYEGALGVTTSVSEGKKRKKEERDKTIEHSLQQPPPTPANATSH